MRIKLGLDIGSTITKIYRSGNGIVLSEPSVIAVSSDGKVRAVGKDAKRLIGKTAENTKIIYPIFEGKIVNSDALYTMLKAFFDKIELKSYDRAETVVGVPCGTAEEQLVLYEKTLARFNLYGVKFVEQPILAALGQNIPLNDYSPRFIIDMGGGVTNIAALTVSGVIAGISARIGGTNVDAEIIDYLADKYGMKIGLLTAEKIKVTVASLLPNDITTVVVSGRDIDSGKPRALSIGSMDLKTPVELYYDKVIELANMLLMKLPAETLAEIKQKGVYISGGGALIVGAEKYIADFLGFDVTLSDNPTLITALGAGIAAESERMLEDISLAR